MIPAALRSFRWNFSLYVIDCASVCEGEVAPGNKRREPQYISIIKEDQSMNLKEIKRGQIYIADLNPVVGSEQGGVRPFLILQNDIGNLHSPTIIGAAVTSNTAKDRLPTHVFVAPRECLRSKSIVLLEQVRTIDKSRLKRYLCTLDHSTMEAVNRALLTSIDLRAPRYRPLTICVCPFCIRRFYDSNLYFQRSLRFENEQYRCDICQKNPAQKYYVYGRQPLPAKLQPMS